MSKKWDGLKRIAVEPTGESALVEIQKASPVRISFAAAANAAIREGAPIVRKKMERKQK